MSFDLTNKNISDTYQNLLQKTGSDNQLYDLVGNPIQDLTIQGTLHAQSYIVSESVTVVTSGSTIFGNSSDDSHTFTGDITASGDISASGKIITHQIGDASGNHDLLLRGNNVTIQTDINNDFTFREGISTRFKYDSINDEFVFFKGLDVTGNITASGNINASAVQVDGTSVVTNVVASATQGSFNQIKGGTAGTVQLTDLAITGNPKFNHITASGNISASGDLTSRGGTIERGFIVNNGGGAFATVIKGNTDDNLFLANVTPSGIDKVAIGTNSFLSKLTINGDLTTESHITASGNISSSGTIIGSNLSGTNTGDQDLSSYLQNSDTGSMGDLTVAGHITASAGHLLIIPPDLGGGASSIFKTSGDLNNYKIELGDVNNAANGTLLTIDDTEDVGVTITGPTGTDSHALTVTGNISASKIILKNDGNAQIVADGPNASTGKLKLLAEGDGGVAGWIISGSANAIIMNNLTTKLAIGKASLPTEKLDVVGNIKASGTIFGNSGSFNYITASIIDVDADTIRFGGEPFTKANIQALKQGKSLKSIRAGRVNPDMIAHDGNFTGDITASGDIVKTKTLQMTNSSSVVNTFNTGSFRSSKYLLQVTSASNYQVSEMLVLHNDGTALNTEYAQLNSGVNLINFTTEVNDSNVELIASSLFISCSVKFERTIIPT